MFGWLAHLMDEYYGYTDQITTIAQYFLVGGAVIGSIVAAAQVFSRFQEQTKVAWTPVISARGINKWARIIQMRLLMLLLLTVGTLFGGTIGMLVGGGLYVILPFVIVLAIVAAVIWSAVKLYRHKLPART